MRLALLALAALLAALLAPAAAAPVVARHRGAVSHPSGAWERLDRAPAGAALPLTVALRNSPEGLARLRRTVEEVSTPGGARYGRYLSLEEVSAMTAPAAGAAEAVEAFFRGELGAEVERTLSGDFLQVTVRADAVEAAFASQGARVHAFRHRRSGRVMLRAASPAALRLPEEVERHVELVTGLQDFMQLPADRRAARSMAGRVTRAPLAAADAAAPYASSPDFVRVAANQGDFKASLLLYCQDGAVATDASAPCASRGAALTGVRLGVSPRGGDEFNVTWTAAELQCGDAGGRVVCMTPDVEVPEFRRFNLTATALFAGGDESEAFPYGTEAATSPLITPRSIFDMYGVPRGMRGTHPNNSQAVGAFEDQWIDVDGDLRRFFDDVGERFVAPTIRGQNDPSHPGGESSLDICYIMGVAPGVPTTFWSVSGSGPAKPPGNGAYILTWALQVANTTNPPLVTSHSYGDNEAAFEFAYGSTTYIDRMNMELAKMAARGLTVIAGSGDAGVSNVGEAGNDITSAVQTCTPFTPFYPSNSPYVLSVGSTYASKNSLPVCDRSLTTTGQAVECNELGERVVSISDGIYWTSGGGFSNLTSNPTPSWQRSAVTEYLSTHKASLPPRDVFNPAGRAYPDVVTLGHSLLIEWGGKLLPIDGTSASGPVLAGLVSLLNDQRLNAGKPPVGFLNPLLYSLYDTNPSAFNDVTVGRNFDGDHQLRGSQYPSRCPYGFSAVPGYDPASGLGSPNWAVLRDAVMSV